MTTEEQQFFTEHPSGSINDLPASVMEQFQLLVASANKYRNEIQSTDESLKVLSKNLGIMITENDETIVISIPRDTEEKIVDVKIE